MSSELKPIDDYKVAKVLQVMVAGDLSKLTDEERLNYYQKTCETLGLNPMTRPFEFITLNGKLTLYARKDCTDQLRSINGISLEVTGRKTEDKVHTVLVRAKTKDGRFDESTGAVFVGNITGDSLANALMKAETKAKRRVTLSICGLGFLDETEIETIPPQNVGQPKPAPTVTQIDPDAVTAKTLQRIREAMPAFIRANGGDPTKLEDQRRIYGGFLNDRYGVDSGAKLTEKQALAMVSDMEIMGQMN